MAHLSHYVQELFLECSTEEIEKFLLENSQ